MSCSKFATHVWNKFCFKRKVADIVTSLHGWRKTTCAGINPSVVRLISSHRSAIKLQKV